MAAAWGSPHGGTSPGTALQILTSKRQRTDNLIVITDGEENRPPAFREPNIGRRSTGT
jgi:hypothetical protein